MCTLRTVKALPEQATFGVISFSVIPFYRVSDLKILFEEHARVRACMHVCVKPFALDLFSFVVLMYILLLNNSSFCVGRRKLSRHKRNTILEPTPCPIYMVWRLRFHVWLERKAFENDS